MIEIDALHEDAVGLAQQIYELTVSPEKPASSSPLTQSLGSVEPDNLASWLEGAEAAEIIGNRHHCGFFTYISLTSSEDMRAVRHLYFDTAYNHVHCGKISRPDKGIISTSLKANHIVLNNDGPRPLFHFTEKGRQSYLSWMHEVMLYGWPGLHKMKK